MHAMNLAQSGEIGELWQTRYRAAHQGPKEMGASEYFCDWLYDPNRNGGGALIDYCCYGAILSRVLLGRPHSITAVAGNLVKPDIDAEDNAVLLMQYPKAIGIAEASWTQIDKFTSYSTVIYGSEGTLMVEPENSRLLLATQKHSEGKEVEVPELESYMQNPINHFLHGIESGDAFLNICRPGYCRDVQQIIQAGSEAAANGAQVHLPKLEGMD